MLSMTPRITTMNVPRPPYGPCVAQYSRFRLLCRAIAAQHVDCLRRQADMAAHRMPRAFRNAMVGAIAAPALQLHPPQRRFLQDARGAEWNARSGDAS